MDEESFDRWWEQEGKKMLSGNPEDRDELPDALKFEQAGDEEHIRAMCKIAWSNGEFSALPWI